MYLCICECISQNIPISDPPLRMTGAGHITPWKRLFKIDAGVLVSMSGWKGVTLAETERRSKSEQIEIRNILSFYQ